MIQSIPIDLYCSIIKHYYNSNVTRSNEKVTNVRVMCMILVVTPGREDKIKLSMNMTLYAIDTTRR